MSHRFRFLGERQDDGTWRLEGDEARHLAKVLRLGVGADVEVTDGRGVWSAGTVAVADARAVVVAAGPAHHEAAPARRFIFAVGALKPGSVDELLPALTELGVDEIRVFQQRGSAKARLAAAAVERWRRIVVQAVKQCKRAWVPTLTTFASVEAMIAACPENRATGDTARLVLAPSATETLLARLERERGHDLVVVCGGEQGLAPDEELALRQAGFSPCALGPHVLRAATAAVAAAAVVAVHRGTWT